MLKSFAPAIVASDFDGTLADDSGGVSVPVQRAIHEARDAGINVVIVTARPPRWLTHVAAFAGSTILAANGALDYDPVRDHVRVRSAFTPVQVRALARALRDIPGLSMSAELTTGFWRQEAYVSTPPAGMSDDQGQIGSLLEVPEPAVKILARSSVLGVREFHNAVRACVGDRALLHVSTSDGLAELSPPDVTKAHALARYARELGVPARKVWAAGDMPNDVQMLQWAGVGFAVANAHERVIAVADALAPANSADGLAHVLGAARHAHAWGAWAVRH